MGVYIKDMTIEQLKRMGIAGNQLSMDRLVEVPTPHGDLIDRARLSTEMYNEAFETDTDLQRWDSGCWIRFKMFEDKCDSASTVIEAEGK